MGDRPKPIPFAGRHWTALECRYLEHFCKQGFTIRAIGFQLHRDKGSVQDKIYKLGLPYRYGTPHPDIWRAIAQQVAREADVDVGPILNGSRALRYSLPRKEAFCRLHGWGCFTLRGIARTTGFEYSHIVEIVNTWGNPSPTPS